MTATSSCARVAATSTSCRPHERGVNGRLLLTTLALTTVAAVTLTSCAGEDQMGSPAHRMSVWVNGTNFGADIATLVADNARIPKVVPNGSGAVHAACGTLVTDAEMANTNLPSPDPDVTDLLTQAYGLEGTAGNECYKRGPPTRSSSPSQPATRSGPRPYTTRSCSASGPSTARCPSPRRRRATRATREAFSDDGLR